MKTKNVGYIFILTLLIVIGLIAVNAAHYPEKPQAVDKQDSSRHNTSGNMSTASFGAPAEAGNCTYLNITAEGSSKTWAAYYGNVTGTLKLETVDDYAIYSWEVTNPGGKILATETVVSDWTSVYCWNWSKATGDGLRYNEWNTNFSVDVGAVDAINETFDASYDYTPFYIAGQLYDQNVAGRDNNNNLCPAIELFNESGAASGSNQYEEIILERYSPQTTTDFEYTELIYVALLEPDGTGFNGDQVDFQLIVPNDGHGASPTPSNYQFYLELEAS